MLRSMRQLRGCRLGAVDGELGRAVDVYFDDQAWAVRYLVVDTHRWWPGKRVLISPSSLGPVDIESHVLPVSLTKDQVRSSPDVSTHLPVSRQRENELAAYYGWPMYWIPTQWDPASPGMLGGSVGGPGAMVASEPVGKPRERSSDEEHLRSVREVAGYRIMARDGVVGHVEDFLVDDFEWMIRYLVVDTRNFWPGKSVLISPQSVRDMDWTEAQVMVDMDKPTIEAAPVYDPHEPVSRDYEDVLHQHYGWIHYWM